MLNEPTSPAKHFARLRKLKKQKTSKLSSVTHRKFASINDIFWLRYIRGNKTAMEYPPVIPLIPSIKL